MFEDRRDIVIAVLALLIIVLTIVTLYKKEGYDASHPQCSDANIDGGEIFSRGGNASQCPDDFYPSLGGDPASVPLFVKMVQPNYKHCRKRRCEENAAAADAAAAAAAAAEAAQIARIKQKASAMLDERNRKNQHSTGSMFLSSCTGDYANNLDATEHCLKYFGDIDLWGIRDGQYFGEENGYQF